MVENLKQYGVVRSKKVGEVMESLGRALFVPEGTPPYIERPMEIGYNATIYAPYMHAACLQLLEQTLKPGMHALDVGSEGQAVGIEHILELLKREGRMVIPIGNIFQDLKVVDKNPDGSVRV
ncbi:Protein-L-isoaspartate O-methyltransferase 2 [Sarracenia purpurea var. burkii]